MTRIPTTPRRLASLLGVLVLGAALLAGAPAAADDHELVGQLVFTLSAERRAPATAEGAFTSPHGRALLRVRGSADAAAVIRVNGRALPEAQQGIRTPETTVVDASHLVDRGSNTLSVRLARGSGEISVDYPTLHEAEPAEAGVDPGELAALADHVAAHAGTGEDDRYAGAAVLVAYRGQIVHRSAHGHAQTHEGAEPLPAPRPMEPDTIFDLASITKVAATTAALMRLVDEGAVGLDDPLVDHLPELAGDVKGDITLRQLLTHRSGLWEWQPTYLHARGRDAVLAYLADLEPRYEIGVQRRYSDIGFMLLGAVIENVTGQPLDDYVRTAVHEPLGMIDTGYTPAARDRIAATSHGNPFEYRMIETGSPYPVEGDPDDFEDWRDYTLVGEANDGNAFYGFEGVAGHAGLFGTARDLAVYGQTLLNGGGYADARLASATTVEAFLTEQYDPGQALGFWTNRLSTVGRSGGFGHGGFTGTELLVDPDRELVVVLLTNRQHPGEPYLSVFPVWTGVLDHALRAIDE